MSIKKKHKIKKSFPIIFNRKFQNLFLVLFSLFSLFLLVSAVNEGGYFELFKMFVRKNILLGAVVFFLLETASIVIAPVTTIFMIPLAADIFGPLVTAILSVIGWTTGSALAFMLARRFGRPILERFIAPEKLNTYRQHISDDAEFFTLILLRIMLPVDVLSYAVGLFTVMSFRKYILATIIGITPFSVLYSFGGEALITGDYQKVFYIASLSILFFLLTIAISRREKKRKRGENKIVIR